MTTRYQDPDEDMVFFDCANAYRASVLFPFLVIIAQLSVFLYSHLFPKADECGLGIGLSVGISFVATLGFAMWILCTEPPTKKLMVIYSIMGFASGIAATSTASVLKSGCVYSSLTVGFGVIGVMALVYALLAFGSWVCCRVEYVEIGQA